MFPAHFHGICHAGGHGHTAPARGEKDDGGGGKGGRVEGDLEAEKQWSVCSPWLPSSSWALSLASVSSHGRCPSRGAPSASGLAVPQAPGGRTHPHCRPKRRQAISQSNKKISRVVWAWATPGSVLTKARAAPRGLGKRPEAFLCTGTLTSVRQSPCPRSPQAGLAPSPASSLLSCQRQAGDGGRASRALQTCLS